MRILLHKRFEKQFAKLTKKQEKRYEERVVLFIRDPAHPLLHNHALSGVYQGYRSINISSDVRVIYEPVNKTTVRFIYIGTHSELYS